MTSKFGQIVFLQLYRGKFHRGLFFLCKKILPKGKIIFFIKKKMFFSNVFTLKLQA